MGGPGRVLRIPGMQQSVQNAIQNPEATKRMIQSLPPRQVRLPGAAMQEGARQQLCWNNDHI